MVYEFCGKTFIYFYIYIGAKRCVWKNFLKMSQQKEHSGSIMGVSSEISMNYPKRSTTMMTRFSSIIAMLTMMILRTG
jgi:hypothetical protein